MADWEKFVFKVASQDVRQDRKIVQLSQAIVESGRGTSELFQKHLNPFGMKYRAEMLVIAKPVKYRDDNYCEFKSVSDAAIAYWMFLNRPVYNGWQKQMYPHTLLRHLVKCGYVGDDPFKQEDYFLKVAIRFNEASGLIKMGEWMVNNCDQFKVL